MKPLGKAPDAPNVTLEGKLLQKVRAKNTKGTLDSKPKRFIFNPDNRLVVDNVPGVYIRSRQGKYAHYCYEWDELLIDEHDPEFEACLCGMPNPKT